MADTPGVGLGRPRHCQPGPHLSSEYGEFTGPWTGPVASLAVLLCPHLCVGDFVCSRRLLEGDGLGLGSASWFPSPPSSLFPTHHLWKWEKQTDHHWPSHSPPRVCSCPDASTGLGEDREPGTCLWQQKPVLECKGGPQPPPGALLSPTAQVS